MGLLVSYLFAYLKYGSYPADGITDLNLGNTAVTPSR